MRRLTLWSALIVVLVLALPASGRDTGQIRVSELLVSMHREGVTETYRTQIRDRGDNVIGYGAYACFYVSRSNNLRECIGTISLPGGNIMIQGPVVYRVAYSFAITGGSGRYIGALGGGRAARVRPLRWVVTLNIQ